MSKPVIKKAHHTQLPETPLDLTISVTKLGVSVEKVVATIESPKSHQGILLPERKYSLALLLEDFETYIPIPKEIAKNKKIIIQSSAVICIF